MNYLNLKTFADYQQAAPFFEEVAESPVPKRCVNNDDEIQQDPSPVLKRNQFPLNPVSDADTNDIKTPQQPNVAQTSKSWIQAILLLFTVITIIFVLAGFWT